MRLWQRIEANPASIRRSHLLGISFMCATAFLWSLMEHFVLFIPGKYFPYQIDWMRYGTHLLFMLLVLGRSEGPRLVRTTRPAGHIIRSLAMLGLPIFFVAAARHGSSPDFVWSVAWSSLPIVIAVSAILLREPVTLLQHAAALVGLAGMWLVVGPPLPAFGWGLLLSAAVSLCLGLYVVLTRALRAEPLSTSLFQTALWVFVALTCLMPFVWQPMSPKVAAAMVIVGLWGFLIMLLLTRALVCAPPALIAPFLFTGCLWDAAFETTQLNADFPLWKIAGAGLILVVCGSLLTRELRRKHADRPISSESHQTLPTA